MRDDVSIPSGIVEPFMPKWTDEDDAIVEQVMEAVIDAADPQDFDRLVNANPAWQRTLLRWRGHLTLSARAFYRAGKRAWTAMQEEPDEKAAP